MPELALLGAGADALDRGAGFVPADGMARGDGPRQLLAVSGDGHLFTAFDPVEQLAESVFVSKAPTSRMGVSVQAGSVQLRPC